MKGPIRVALVGAHGTGKTTLAKALVGSLTNMEIEVRNLSEAPRLICDRAGDPTFFRRGNNTPLRQNLILLVHLLQELDLSNNVDVLISDRSLLDHWAYTLHLFGRELDEEGLRQLYEAFVVDHCRHYDVLFFLPIEFAVIDDGTREGDSRFQAEIEQCMLDLIGEYQIEVQVVRGPLEERTEFCSSVLLSELKARQKGK
jgi:nicotinamide riboside kinase